MPVGPFNREQLLAEYHISEAAFKQTGLSWDELEGIARAHIAAKRELESVGRMVIDQFDDVPEVHSLRYRIKDPAHLVVKVIRKRIEQPQRVITVQDYTTHITDLVGVRVLHLTKERWEPIHDYITGNWKRNEKPTAYYREGDQSERIGQYRDKGCKALKHNKGYRSVHYVIRVPLGRTIHRVEIQVRTIFEEGWAELDHHYRYPSNQSGASVDRQLTLLNMFAGFADELAQEVVSRAKEEVSHAIQLMSYEQQVNSQREKIKRYIHELNLKNL